MSKVNDDAVNALAAIIYQNSADFILKDEFDCGGEVNLREIILAYDLALQLFKDELRKIRAARNSPNTLTSIKT